MGLGLGVGFGILHSELTRRNHPKKHFQSSYRPNHADSPRVRARGQQATRESTDSCTKWQNILLIVGLIAFIAGVALVILSFGPPILSAMFISGMVLALGGALSTFFGAVR